MATEAGRWILWGSRLSPFALKVELLLRLAGRPYAWMPATGPFGAALRHARQRDAVARRREPLTWPPLDPLDELPLVPFLFGPAGERLYDSSAIGVWLAGHDPDARLADLLPAHDTALQFAVRLVDEALDEVGLYCVHHNRWVIAARDNDAGVRLGREMRPLLGPFACVVAWQFPRRQVRRLPYLFSVARAGDATWDDLPAAVRPPTRPGFPPTHALLDALFAALLAAIEPILAARPFLFGERPTLADTSVYGQLAMNHADPSAWRRIAANAPATAAWVERLARGAVAAPARGALALDDTVAPLLAWIATGFVPLMRQNATAWARHRAAGETRFNERAFDAGRALYDGTLLDQPFRSVAKTFQVRVWRDLRRDWQALDAGAQRRIAALMPADDLG